MNEKGNKVSKGIYEYTAPNGDIWIIKNLGYGRGFGSVRWVARTDGIGIKYAKEQAWKKQIVRRTKYECIDVIKRGG
tara:strand:- start:901 stop:1131 length:231 start_codon:yes stop_codon:yes gene_type:complete